MILRKGFLCTLTPLTPKPKRMHMYICMYAQTQAPGRGVQGKELLQTLTQFGIRTFY